MSGTEFSPIIRERFLKGALRHQEQRGEKSRRTRRQEVETGSGDRIRTWDDRTETAPSPNLGAEDTSGRLA